MRPDPDLREAHFLLEQVERAAHRTRLALHAAEDSDVGSDLRHDALQALAEGSADTLDAARPLLTLVRRDSRR